MPGAGVWLPAIYCCREDTGEAGERASESIALIKVLIADNNIDLCLMLKEHLSQEPGIAVVGMAHRGDAALELTRRQKPDVLLLDIVMPHLDGLSVLERLHQVGPPKPPAVLVITVISHEDILKRCTAMGARYVLLKPFDLQVLVRRIKQFSTPDDPFVPYAAKENGNAAAEVQKEVALAHLMHQLGVPPHLKGYKYLKEAVLLVQRQEYLLTESLSKSLYPGIAAKFGSTASGVEGAIRHAVAATWRQGNRRFLQELLSPGGSGDGDRRPETADRFPCPTNAVLIRRLAAELRKQRESRF